MTQAGTSRPAGGPSAYLKQTALFLLAVVLPSSVLVLLSLRLIAQERELVEKRTSERRELVGRQFGEALAKQLREVAGRVATLEPARVGQSNWMRLDPHLALVALVGRDRLILPWNRQHEAEAFAEAVQQGSYAGLLAAGQRHEFNEEELALALAEYREAAHQGALPAQEMYASLAIARVLAKTGATQDAELEVGAIMRGPLAVCDEFEVPLVLYAAGQLLGWSARLELVLATIEDALSSGVPLSSTAIYMVRDYLEELHWRLPDRREQVEKCQREVQSRIALHEHGEQLSRDFTVVRAALDEASGGSAIAGRWTLYGVVPWLVSIAPWRGSEELALLAVEAGGIATRAWEAGTLSMPGDTPRFVRGTHPHGVWLGDDFPNLQLILPRQTLAAGIGEPQLNLYWMLILLVVGITLFGASLWWRDTRREMRLAEMRSDFVSSVSHELKTPLTSVRMLAETLRIREVATKERNEYLDLILSESERLGRLLKNVLDFAQIEKGTKIYHLEPVEMGTLIEAVVRCIQEPLREKELMLDVLSNGTGVWLNGDRDALEQALLNLLYNAIKYSNKAGRIELWGGRAGHEAVIHVRDYGVGIHPRDHHRIFERFYRAPEDHNRKIPGTGLGLSLVAHVVQSHGGRVAVDSAPDRGSTFAIHLPARLDV